MSERKEFAARINGDLPRIAFYYGANDPARLLGDFRIAVVDPGHAHAPGGQPATGGPQWLAYLSLGEILPCMPYFSTLPPAWRIGKNAAWRAWIIDQAATGWSDFLVDRIARPIWQKGYQGFFLDTVDSYTLLDPARHSGKSQRAGLVHAIRRLRAAFPQAAIILNRGFELLSRVYTDIDAVAFESLYLGWNPSDRHYQPVPEHDRSWLLDQAARVRSYGLPVIAIDYCSPRTPPAQVHAARRRIRQHGFVAYVADHTLHQVYPHRRGSAHRPE